MTSLTIFAIGPEQIKKDITTMKSDKSGPKVWDS